MARLIEQVLNQVLEAQVTEQLQAAPYERTEQRQGYRNGYKPRQLTTRVGTLTLQIPQVREGQFSTDLFARYQRSEQALVLTLMEMVVNGVSTRKVAHITEELCGKEFAKSTVSDLCRQRGNGKKARIYVNGLHVADEENFLFSYNITSLTAPLRKALNRERTNVGRSAYTDRVKAILLACQDATVADALARDLQNLERGTTHDELQWLDVQLHACRILNANEKVVFVTSEQLLAGGALITYAQKDGYRVVVIPTSIASKLPTLQDVQGQPIHTLDEYRKEWNDSFHYTFIPPEQLRPEEQAIYALTKSIMGLLARRTNKVKGILISETMRLNRYDNNEAVGIWEEDEQRIIIKRDQLRSLVPYAGTLLHEFVHALSGADDETLEFEQGLTEALGTLAERALKTEQSQKHHTHE